MKGVKIVQVIMGFVCLLCLASCKNIEITYFGLVEHQIHFKDERRKKKRINHAKVTSPKTELPSKPYIHGVVLEGGVLSPIRGLNVILLKNGEYLQVTETDSAGKYEFHDLNEGLEYEIMVENKGYASKTVLAKFPDKSGLEQNIIIDKYHKVSGVISYGLDNIPVPRAVIIAKGANGHIQTAASNESGKYVLSELIDTLYTVSVFHKNHSYRSREVELVGVDILEEVHFVAGALTLNGSINDANSHQPIAGAKIMVRSLSPSESMNKPESVFYGDESGEFSAINLNEGTYEIQISSNGYGVHVERLEMGADTLQRLFRLFGESVVRGTVVNHELIRERTPMVLLNEQHILSVDFRPSSGGAFEIKGLPKGDYKLIVADDSSSEVITEFTLNQFEQTKNVIARVPNTNSSLSGFVLDSNQKPLYNQEILIVSPEAQYSTNTNQKGEYHFPNIVASNYSIVAYGENWNANTVTTVVVSNWQKQIVNIICKNNK